MEIRMEINNFNELYDMSWSGGRDTLDDIFEHGKEEALMNLLEEVFFDEIPSDTEVNDFLWFERDIIYENIGLTEDGELPEDEMKEVLNESIESLKIEDEFEDFCNDCDTCVFNDICSTIEDCNALFEDYKNQVVTIDDIKDMVEEKVDINIWR
jgi:hypothetical protein